MVSCRRLALAASLVVCAGVAAAPPLLSHPFQPDQSLIDIVERHTAWRGGASAIEAVTAVRMTLRIQEATFFVIGTYVADRQGRVRVDMEAGGQTIFREGTDEEGSWSQSRSEPVLATTVVAQTGLERGRLFNLYGLHELPRLGHRLTLEGEEDIAGRHCQRIRVDMADGFRMWRVIDSETGEMLMRRETREQRPRPDAEPKLVSVDSYLNDYRRVGGVMFPFQLTHRDHDTGDLRSRTDLLSLEVNPRLTNSDLRRPQVGGPTIKGADF